MTRIFVHWSWEVQDEMKIRLQSLKWKSIDLRVSCLDSYITAGTG